ncbi:M23 family metallopeptidase [Candidatus Woesearchaeota archaeon]|nr:M23 family metallopeptidase [Candidatus Woesearchaeota archaeon]
MGEQTLESELRFTEGHTTPRNERLLRELAKAIEESPIEPNRFNLSHIIGAGLTGLAAIVESSSFAVAQDSKIVYPPGAPKIASDYLDTWGFLRGRYGYERTLGPHTGIDIDVLIGHPVLAAADGVIFRSHWSNDSGWRIVIEHGKDVDGSYLRTIYLHNDKNLVAPGENIKRGQIIALSGVSGRMSYDYPHLHFMVYKGPTQKYSEEWTHVNPHEYWVDGPYRITCFDTSKGYQNSSIRFTYPVECKLPNDKNLNK